MTADTFKNITLQNPEEWHTLLLKTVPSEYDLLFQTIRVSHGNKIFQEMVENIAWGEFNEEQKKALTTAITKQHLRILFEELHTLLLKTAPSEYDSLFKNIRLSHSSYILDDLAKSISKGTFNEEQKNALATAITKHHHRFLFQGSLLHWAVQTSDIEFVKKATTSLSKNLDYGKRAIVAKDDDGKMILHQVQNNPEFLKKVLKLCSNILKELPEKKCFEFLQIRIQDKKIKDYYIKTRVLPSLKDSNIEKYLRICILLEVHSSPGIFNSSNKALLQFKQQVANAKSFSDVQRAVQSYSSSDISSKFTKKLLNILTPSPKDNPATGSMRP